MRNCLDCPERRVITTYEHSGEVANRFVYCTRLNWLFLGVCEAVIKPPKKCPRLDDEIEEPDY